MLENQIIGISGVFVLTFCLIAVYHLIGKLSHSRNRFSASLTRVKAPAHARRPAHQLRDRLEKILRARL